jgi:hypothetical protein
MAEISLARSFGPGGAGRQTAALVASPDRTAGLRRIAVPTLVIHGLLDPLVRPAGGVATARAVPGSRLLMFNDMGHGLPRARRQEMVDAIAENASRPTSPSRPAPPSWGSVTARVGTGRSACPASAHGRAATDDGAH